MSGKLISLLVQVTDCDIENQGQQDREQDSGDYRHQAGHISSLQADITGQLEKVDTNPREKVDQTADQEEGYPSNHQYAGDRFKRHLKQFSRYFL